MGTIWVVDSVFTHAEIEKWQINATDSSLKQTGAPEDLLMNPEDMDLNPEDIQTDHEAWTIAPLPKNA